MRTIYVVTGLPRTGTSMMMRCLHESSDLILVGDSNMDELPKDKDGNPRPRTPEYDFNPYGCYEVSHLIPWEELPDKALVKRILTTNWMTYPEQDDVLYRVCLCLRKKEEVRMSWVRTFGYEWAEERFDIADSLVAAIARRNDVELTSVHYDLTIADPLGAFEHLTHDGWPIDPVKAASLVEDSLYRHRSEVSV